MDGHWRVAGADADGALLQVVTALPAPSLAGVAGLCASQRMLAVAECFSGAGLLAVRQCLLPGLLGRRAGIARFGGLGSVYLGWEQRELHQTDRYYQSGIQLEGLAPGLTFSVTLARRDPRLSQGAPEVLYYTRRRVRAA